MLLYFNKTVGLLGKGAQDGDLDFHTVPELCRSVVLAFVRIHLVVFAVEWCLRL